MRYDECRIPVVSCADGRQHGPRSRLSNLRIVRGGSPRAPHLSRSECTGFPINFRAQAQTWNRVTPCNAGLDVLRQAAAQHFSGRQVIAAEFDTISVSGIFMGSEGMRASPVSRDWIADSVE